MKQYFYKGLVVHEYNESKMVILGAKTLSSVQGSLDDWGISYERSLVPNTINKNGRPVAIITLDPEYQFGRDQLGYYVVERSGSQIRVTELKLKSLVINSNSGLIRTTDSKIIMHPILHSHVVKFLGDIHHYSKIVDGWYEVVIDDQDIYCEYVDQELTVYELKIDQ
jgi:hypothetical protein